jgi:ADP-ribose pyrophosphatase YjhB (NUDIX family)
MTEHRPSAVPGTVRLAAAVPRSTRVSDQSAADKSDQYRRDRTLEVEGRRRIGTKVVVRDEECVLLIRESRADGTTFWSLPGGGRQRGEGLRECLRREVREELQCGVRLGQIIGSCTYRHSRAEGVVSTYAVFRGRLRGPPSPSAAEGVREVRWIEPSSPPAGTLPPFRSLLGAIATEPTER